MEKATTYARAIRAGISGSGIKREELAEIMGMNVDTLGRKLKHRPGSFTLDELERADRAIRWSKYMEAVR